MPSEFGNGGPLDVSTGTDKEKACNAVRSGHHMETTPYHGPRNSCKVRVALSETTVQVIYFL